MKKEFHMKKLIVLFSLLMTLPCLSACPIESGEMVCSVAGFREQVTPTYQPRGNIREFSSSPEARLNAIDRSEISKQIRDFSATESNFNYNSSCQFGVCLQQDQNTPLFQQKKH